MAHKNWNFTETEHGTIRRRRRRRDERKGNGQQRRWSLQLTWRWDGGIDLADAAAEGQRAKHLSGRWGVQEPCRRRISHAAATSSQVPAPGSGEAS